MIDISEFFSEVEYFVKATSFEQVSLWKEYSPLIQWGKPEKSYTCVVDYIEGKPINVCFTSMTINGNEICFYETVSRCNDEVKVNAFLSDYGAKFNENWCDASNFHLCYHFCK